MRFIVTFLAVAALAIGGASLAVAGGSPATPAATHAKVLKVAKVAKVSKHNVRKTAGETPGETSSPENDADAAAQAAACKAAGVDPNGSNVNYDDATGTCSANG
jgi:hypothetical protein